MASRRMKIKTMAKLPSSSRSRPVDRPKTPSLMSPGPYGEPPSPSTNLFSPTPSIPPPPSSPKPSTFPPNCPPSPKPPVVYHIYPPPSPKYNTYDDSGGPVPSPSNVLSVSSAGLLSPRTPQSHHNTPVPSPMPPSPVPSSSNYTGIMSPRRPTTPKTPLSFHGESDRENSQDSFINPPTPIYFSSYSALSPGMGPGIPSSSRAPPSISPGPSNFVPEDLGGKSAFASLSSPFNNPSNISSGSGGDDIKTTSNRTKIIKSEMTPSSSSLSQAIVPRPSTPTTTITTMVPYGSSSNSSPSKYNSTTPQNHPSGGNTDNKDSSGPQTSSTSTVVVHHHHHHHQPHVSNAPNNTDTLRQRLQKGSIAPTTSKYAMIRKEYISKYQNKSPNPKDLTILHYAFFNPPKAEKPTDESLEDEDEIFNEEDIGMDKDKTKTLETPKIPKKKQSSPPPPSTPTSTAPPQTTPTTTDSSLKEINEAEKKQSIAPKVKIGPDGQLIIDEQSLVIETSEAKRAKEQLAQMETVSGSTYAVGSSGIYYRKKPFKRGTDWTEKETLKFYRALISCGTDFSMMESVFKHRTRSELKAKFKREDRRNQEQVSRALQKQVFDPSFALTDSEDEKEQEEQLEQMIGKVKTTSKKRKSTEKEGGSIEKINKTNISNNDNVVSTETKTKDGKQRKPRRKSAAIAPPVKDFFVKNPKNGKVDWDLSRSIEQESIDKQKTTVSNSNGNIISMNSSSSNNLTIQKDTQVESTNIVTNNNNNNGRTNHEIISKNVLVVEGINSNIVSDNIKTSQTIKNNSTDIIKNKTTNRNRNKNIDASNINSNIDDTTKNNNSSNNSNNDTNNKKPTTSRKRSNSTSASTSKAKKSKKETNKRVCTLIQPKKPVRKSTRKKSTTEDKDNNNQSKVLPQIFRFDAEDPLGLKIVEGITNLSMPSLEKETTSSTATTTTLSTVHTKEFKSTIQSTSSTSDIISSDSNSGKSYITLVPSTRKLRKNSLNKSQSESVTQKDHSSNINLEQQQPSSSSTTTQGNTTSPQNPLPLAATKKTSLKRKGTPYRLPGPGPGTFPAPPTTLVDEIEIEITCK